MTSDAQIVVQDLRLAYGRKEVIHGISFDIQRNEIFGIIGPAQSGKTSLLRCLNRTIDFTPEARVSGSDPGGRRRRAADEERLCPPPQDRHGRAAAGWAAHEHLRQRRLRSALRRHEPQESARRDRRTMPAPGRPLGRGEGPPRQPRHQALRRPAAAPDHRPRPLASAARSSAWTSSRSPSTR